MQGWLRKSHKCCPGHAQVRDRNPIRLGEKPEITTGRCREVGAYLLMSPDFNTSVWPCRQRVPELRLVAHDPAGLRIAHSLFSSAVVGHGAPSGVALLWVTSDGWFGGHPTVPAPQPQHCSCFRVAATGRTLESLPVLRGSRVIMSAASARPGLP